MVVFNSSFSSSLVRALWFITPVTLEGQILLAPRF